MSQDDFHISATGRTKLRSLVGRKIRTSLIIAGILGTLSLAGCGSTMAAVPTQANNHSAPLSQAQLR